MRSLLLVLLASALPALAQQPGNQPATPPPTPPAPAPAPQPPPAKPIPVPAGAPVNKSELEGGLVIEDLKIGDGFDVKPGGAIVALYHGTRKTDGHVFDSAFNRGEPIAFSLNNVIQGWQKGIPGMKVGGIRRLTIPAPLGYGTRGSGPDIPPNTDLVFVVQVVDALHVEDITLGDGPQADTRFIPVTAHRFTDASGNEVEKCAPDRPYVWIPGEMNAPGSMFDTMQLAIDGMKVGGKRKVHIPALMNGHPPIPDLTRPDKIDLDGEITLVALRNLPRPGGR